MVGFKIKNFIFIKLKFDFIGLWSAPTPIKSSNYLHILYLRYKLGPNNITYCIQINRNYPDKKKINRKYKKYYAFELNK